MAIATLAEVYNNPDVFRGVVKIRKGLACRMILESSDLNGLSAWFHKAAADIASRVPATDPSARRTIEVCTKAIDLTKFNKRKGPGLSLVLLAALPAIAASFYFYR